MQMKEPRLSTLPNNLECFFILRFAFSVFNF